MIACTNDEAVTTVGTCTQCLAGEIQDTSKKAVLKQIEFADSYQEEEIISLALKDVGLI